ncbi:hypothetical protein KJ733_00750 [Patescibacteria group bacterium]|nr:hypothetical protein [Patescibacteria group bacterium]MBU2228975.1 hypothetical protein [Patescibacteria group bacterium]
MEEEKNQQEEQTPMLKKQESDPEKMLPPGHLPLGMKFLYLIVINAVVFGAIYIIVKIFFVQGGDISLMFAEIITAITLIGSVAFLITKRNK